MKQNLPDAGMTTGLDDWSSGDSSIPSSFDSLEPPVLLSAPTSSSGSCHRRDLSCQRRCGSEHVHSSAPFGPLALFIGVVRSVNVAVDSSIILFPSDPGFFFAVIRPVTVTAG